MILSYYNEYIVLDVLKTNYPIVEQYGPLSSNRAMGFINLGDGNSQTIFCAYILSIVLYAFFNGYINSTIVIISFMSCFINIAFIASRGGLLTGILVILLNIGKHITFNKKTVFEISILISAIILFVYFNYQKLYYVSYRMLKSGVTQNDLDPKAKSGRLVSAIEGIDYIVENPNILLNGDTKAKFNLYGQTVHNGFVKSIHYAGILGIVWVLYMLIYAQKKIGKGRLSIIIPFIISLLTLPDFYFLYYLFYAIYYIDIIKYEKYERNK
jgi:hypothetical protein